MVVPCWLNVPFPNQCILNLWFQNLQILKLVQKLLCFVISAIKIYIMRYLCITEGDKGALYMLILPLYLCISHALLHTVSGLLHVGVQELSSCFVEEVTVTRGTALCDAFCGHETLHNNIEGSQTYTPHTYLQGKKLFATALWSRLMIVEMHWPRPYMAACLDGS